MLTKGSRTTVAEFRKLFESAGFKLQRLSPLRAASTNRRDGSNPRAFVSEEPCHMNPDEVEDFVVKRYEIIHSRSLPARTTVRTQAIIARAHRDPNGPSPTCVDSIV
jgi:hypothetical protein